VLEPDRHAGTAAGAWKPPGPGEPQGEPRARAARGRGRRARAAGEDEGAERDPVAAARDAALRLLTVRARGRAELERRLGDRGLPQEAVASALDRLEAVGLVDDAAFASAYAESRAGRGVDAGAITRELRGRGVDPQLAAQAAGTAAPPDEQAERCRQVAAAKLARMDGLSPDVQFRRLAAYLDRRGYPAELIEHVVRELVEFEEGGGSGRL
jgi:regulatory protein